MDERSSAALRQSRTQHTHDHDDDRLDQSPSEHSGAISSPQLPEDDAQRQHSSSSLHFSDAPDATDLTDGRERSLDDREIRRQLGELESSFMPESDHAESEEQRLGADDTYMNLGSTSNTSTLRHNDDQDQRYEDEHDDDDERNETMSEEGDYERFRESHSSTEQDVQDSPSAMAAQRNTARTTTHSNQPFETSAHSDAKESTSLRSDNRPSSHSSLARSRSSGSDNQHNQRTLQRRMNDSRLGDTTITAMGRSSSSSPDASPNKRPNNVPNRIASYTSTRSSASNSTINADFSSSTGVPGEQNSPLSTRTARDLTRLPSFGSVVSDVSRDAEAGKPSFNRGFSAATGLARSKIHEEEEEAGSPVTPRAAGPASQSAQAPLPSDTVIAAHVRDIRVPETVARDFHSRFGGGERGGGGFTSPDKRSASVATNATTTTGTGTVSRGGQSTLTLKEQGSKIDKLTKENFDLKLKIHFLDQALQSRSDEGVRATISRSVELQTELAKERRDNASLRRRIRELENRVREVEEELAEERERSEEVKWAGQVEMEVEIGELREEVDVLRVRVATLAAEKVAGEKERVGLREMLDDGRGQGMEEVDMWRDLLTEEQGRREGVEDEARSLREEVGRLRREKERWTREREQGERSRSIVSASDGGKSAGGGIMESLRQENMELRRDLSAQTSMLSSRNKERERLQQEIEDLKLSNRKGGDRGGSLGDGILERSASRAARTPSRVSGMTGGRVSEAERDEYERREGLLRDENAQLRLEYQDVEKEADARLDYINQLEEDVKNLEIDLSAAVEDLRALQKERDEALVLIELRESDLERLTEDYRKLEEEAVLNIEGLEANIDQVQGHRDRTASELKLRNDDFGALQTELRSLGSRFLQLESDREVSLKRIETLESELDDATRELESLERKLRESDQKNGRLEVQSESLQNEVGFLREEQQADKIKIGDLTNALHAAQQAVADEKERLAELESSLMEERRQREFIDDQSAQEVQKVISDLNAEIGRSRDEMRTLRRGLAGKETEAATFRARLEELENGLRKALGESAGTRTTLLQDVENLQVELSKTDEELANARADVADKTRLIKSRDVLLESSGLEARRLSDLLEKERQARKHDLHNFEMAQRGNSGHMRTIAEHQARTLELETALSQAKRRVGVLEGQYKAQLVERNSLLLNLWEKLSTICGAEWSQQNGGVAGAPASVDSIGKHLPQFQKNVLAACKAIENLFAGFKGRIRMAEKLMAKDVTMLGHTLEQKGKKLEQVERMATELVEVNTQLRTAITNSGLGASTGRSPSAMSGSFGQNKLSKAHQEEMKMLKSEVKSLQKELKIHRALPSEEAVEKIKADADIRPNGGGRRSSMLGLLGVVDGDGHRLSPATIAGKIMRTSSEGGVRPLNLAGSRQSADLSRQGSTSAASSSTNRMSQDLEASRTSSAAESATGTNDRNLMHRLREMEKRLKAEREARLLDRKGARQRLEERSAENEELRAELERERDRIGSISSLDSFQSAGGGDDTEHVSTPRASTSRREAVERRRERSQDSVD